MRAPLRPRGGRGRRALRAREVAAHAVARPRLGAGRDSVGRTFRGLVRRGLAPNVRVSQLDPLALRQLYARARFAVVAVTDGEFDNGITALTEAWAMGKPVIASRTPALARLFTHGEQGLFVPVGDPRALRGAIEWLLAHPAEAERMGRAGRAQVERQHRLDDCMRRLAAVVRGSVVAGQPGDGRVN